MGRLDHKSFWDFRSRIKLLMALQQRTMGRRAQDFHVFEVEWDPEIIKFFIDGVQVHSTTTGKDDR